MGMSLWRMYSAREQDQPPSVLLVGTFYKKQQEPGPGLDYLMPHVSQAFSMPKKQPSSIPPHQTFPGGHILLLGTTKSHVIPLAAPF